MTGDRRRKARGDRDRRNVDTRLPGRWTESERDRFIAELREARRDAQAIVIRGGKAVPATAGDTE